MSDATSAQTVALVSSSHLSSSSAAEEGRFVPGTLLGGRYRIIALLGRGGMGEVYRATDLTLGQSVALKFLPEEASRDQRLLERFHGEVRVARQVSHPNVCRVYDIGEIDGTPFISMEYVDGEDLASLLTRIGRLPADKALETARKICAGLAAAHDRGIIHRDLKPQNIMMNKRGEVIIMDFGLAALAGHLAGDITSGTPAYMAPEQLKGAEVTTRSDVYALGLVLYELFTGKRPFEAKTIRQMLEMQESAHLTSMTSVAAEIDPAVEKAVRRCLDPDPSKRPVSALAVAAALPGGDPLAAALAAGETPSPELVANAGETEGLARKYSIPCLVVLVGSLVSTMFWVEHGNALVRAPLDLPPPALAAKAREIAASLGYPRRPADSHISLEPRGAYVEYLTHLPEPRQWSDWLAAEAPLAAAYRESPAPLVAPPEGEVTGSNPPPTSQGMVDIRLDGYSRLLGFDAVPYELADQPKEPIPPEIVFRAAGYDIAAFTETTPQELPVHAADQIRAWKGPHPKLPNTEVAIEIASFRGRITRLRIAPPWAKLSPKPAAAGISSRFSTVYQSLLTVIVMVFAIAAARRNWKLGRVDRKGAFRVAAARFLLAIVVWIGIVHAVPEDSMFGIFNRALSDWLLSGAVIWVLYLALEPSIRARWPHSVVTWNRLLAGRWRDAQVASHILIGGALGCAMWELFGLSDLVFGQKNRLFAAGNFFALLGTRQWLGVNAAHISDALLTGFSYFFGLFFLRTILKRDWLAAIAAAVIGIWVEGIVVGDPGWQLKAAVMLVVYFGLFVVMLRFGLLASMSAVFFVNTLSMILIGFDWTTWYAPYALATMTLFLALTIAAFYRSLGKRTLFGGEEAEAA